MRRSGGPPPFQPPEPLQPSSTTAMSGGEVFGALDGDAVLGLRVYGTEVEHRFPGDTPWGELIVGSGSDAHIPIADRTVSRRHARVFRDGGYLLVQDEGSKNGTYCEGERRRASFELRPGTWLAFGRVHLAAFSAATEGVRARLQRFLGFGAPFLCAVDDAQYAITHRRHLVLIMPKGSAPTLTQIVHDAVPGKSAPLIEVGQRIANYDEAQRELVERAAGGTLVIQSKRWPRNPATLRALLSERHPASRLVFVVNPGFDVEAALGHELRDRVVTLRVPTLEERGALEIEQAIAKAAAEYGGPLGLSAFPFTPRELRRSWGSPEVLEFFVRRAVRVKLRGVTEAAALEGVQLPAMSRWAARNVERAR